MTVIATMLRHYDRNYVITTKITSLTLAQDASACSLCRRFAPYDCNVVEWKNLNIVNIRYNRH